MKKKGINYNIECSKSTKIPKPNYVDLFKSYWKVVGTVLAALGVHFK